MNETMTAEEQMHADWIPGDAVNNVSATLRYYERKRDEEPWWCFWGKWYWHDSVRAAERQRDRVYRQNGVVWYGEAMGTNAVSRAK